MTTHINDATLFFVILLANEYDVKQPIKKDKNIIILYETKRGNFIKYDSQATIK